MARLGPPFRPQNPPRKSLCGSLFCVRSQEMSHFLAFFFWGPKMGCFGFMLKKFMCFFRPHTYCKRCWISGVLDLNRWRFRHLRFSWGRVILPVKSKTLRAQRLKKINLDWNFQSRLKISISLEIFNPGPSEFPTKKIGFWCVARLKISVPIENFNPGGRSWIFSVFGPLGKGTRGMDGTEFVINCRNVPHPKNLFGFVFLTFSTLQG